MSNFLISSGIPGCLPNSSFVVGNDDYDVFTVFKDEIWYQAEGFHAGFNPGNTILDCGTELERDVDIIALEECFNENNSAYVELYCGRHKSYFVCVEPTELEMSDEF